MVIDLIERNKDKIYKQVYGQYVIQPSHKRVDLFDAVEIILKFNETIRPYLT